MKSRLRKNQQIFIGWFKMNDANYNPKRIRPSLPKRLQGQSVVDHNKECEEMKKDYRSNRRTYSGGADCTNLKF